MVTLEVWGILISSIISWMQRSSATNGVVSSGDWVLDDAELAGLFNEKTKAIILNTPNNPLGKVFNRAELTKIADLCKKHNVLCISDEVYEWMVYDDNEHVRICEFPLMNFPHSLHSYHSPNRQVPCPTCGSAQSLLDRPGKRFRWPVGRRAGHMGRRSSCSTYKWCIIARPQHRFK